MSLTARWRLTDLRNGSAQDDSATATEFDFPVPVNCATTADSSIGSACAANTSANAVMPGAIQEGANAVVQVFRVRLLDAGADHTQGNSDDRLFEQQGLFVPGGPTPSYEIPASAPLIDNSLVPNFRQCGATSGNTPNSTHAPPLSVPSCSPPVPTSSVAKVGPQSVGSVQENVIAGDNNPGNGDQADILLALNATDIQSGAGGDYTPNASGPDTTLITRLRLTDLFNGTGSPRTSPGTTQDFDFLIPVNCGSTADPAVGATCNTNTSVDALAPGAVPEDKQTILQVFRLRLQDSGPDGTRLSADDTLLEMQGVYVP
jgi:hypothetical protein